MAADGDKQGSQGWLPTKREGRPSMAADKTNKAAKDGCRRNIGGSHTRLPVETGKGQPGWLPFLNGAGWVPFLYESDWE